MHTNLIQRWLYLVVVCAMLIAPVDAVTWQPIVRSQGPAPGVPGQPNAKHFILNAPLVNNNGQVAFHSYLSSSSVSDFNTDTLWAGAASQPQLVAREGGSAAGTTEAFQSFEFEQLLNNSGQVLVNARVTGDFDQGNGLWLGTPGNLQLVARTQTPIAGLPDMIQDIDASSTTLSDNGKIAFHGTATNDKTALWYGSPGNLVVAAMEGNSVPAGSGLSASVKFEPFSAPSHSPVINSTGKIAFQATISNGGSIYGRSVWTGTPGNLQLLVREETAAPGVPGEEFFLLNTEPVINNGGKVAFGATLSNFNESIWLGTPGSLQKILEGNDPAPVGTAGVRFADFGTYSQLRLSDSGHVGFEGWLEGAGVNADNNYGLFRATTSGVDMVARLGSQAPGMQAGATFEFFTHFSINASGHMSFMGTASGGGVPLGEDRGIWAQNPAGALELVVRIGDWVHPMTGVVVRMADATNTTLLASQGYGEVFDIDIQSAFKLESEFGTAWNSDHKLAFSVTYANAAMGEVLFLADLDPANGDFDGDGDVDGRDFLLWQRTDKTPSGLSAWQANYGAGNLTALAAVPEPTSLAFMIACGMAAMAIRKMT